MRDSTCKQLALQGGTGTPEPWIPDQRSECTARKSQCGKGQKYTLGASCLNIALSYQYLKITNKSFCLHTQQYTFETQGTGNPQSELFKGRGTSLKGELPSNLQL